MPTTKDTGPDRPFWDDDEDSVDTLVRDIDDYYSRRERAYLLLLSSAALLIICGILVWAWQLHRHDVETLHLNDKYDKTFIGLCTKAHGTALMYGPKATCINSNGDVIYREP